MSVNVALRVALALFVGIAFASSALAEDKVVAPPLSQSGNKFAPILSPSGNKIEKLTQAECLGLGGKVFPFHQEEPTNTECKLQCQVADYHGVVRSGCIDEVVH
jgi:hypothetical protein